MIEDTKEGMYYPPSTTAVVDSLVQLPPLIDAIKEKAAQDDLISAKEIAPEDDVINAKVSVIS